jgi:putative oxidoreductase
MHALTNVVARVLYALPFGIFGVVHFLNADKMAGAVPVPGGVFWIYLTGLAMLLGCIGMVTKIQGYWASLGLAALLLVYTLFVHLPLAFSPATLQVHFPQVLKNISLIGGALAFAGIFMRGEAK